MVVLDCFLVSLPRYAMCLSVTCYSKYLVVIIFVLNIKTSRKYPSMNISFYISVNTCSVQAAAYANKSPNSSTIDYSTNITYTCQTGYSHTAGNLTRNCNADGSLTGSLPVCSSKFAR